MNDNLEIIFDLALLRTACMALEKKNHELEIKFHLIPCSKQLACIWYAGDKKKRSFESEAEGIDFW